MRKLLEPRRSAPEAERPEQSAARSVTLEVRPKQSAPIRDPLEERLLRIVDRTGRGHGSAGRHVGEHLH